MAQQANESVLERWVHEYESDPEFIANDLSADVIEEALSLLSKGHHTQTWLANEMGVSRSHVSNILTAPSNLTLLSLARLAVALKVRPKVILNSGQWIMYALPEAGEPLPDYEEIQTDMQIARARAETDTTMTLVVSGRGQGTADATT